jgi:signal transduction histidine kinase
VANQKLMELDRLKSDFFANVSHELRTPLTLILAPIEDLLSRVKAGAVVAPQETLRMVQNNGVRLLQMVNGLLDFSKVSAQKVEVKREPVNILDLTRSIFWDFRAVMQKKGIRDELAAHAPPGFVEMDRYLYERILFNLLSNAVKFTPKGGKISVSLEVKDGQLTLSVADTGIGISQADQKNLFEKFQQVEASSTRRFEGTGLGLALAREFAQLLGGTVTLRSELGEGSVFTLTCLAPAAKVDDKSFFEPEYKPLAVFKEQAAVAGEKAAPAAPGREDLPKILVAEDNPEMAAFITGLLSPFARVLTAMDGAEALDLTRQWRPHLVLSDVMMPGIDGIRLTQEIKTHKETSSTPVVLLTAMTNRESLLKGWEAGADDYLFKPFHPKELEARVKAMLSGLEWRVKSDAYRRQRDALEHFTHIASHDLREPLRKIVNFVQIFKSAQTRLDAESEGYLQSISKAAGRMYRLLDLLMDYSRLDRGAAVFEKENLAEVVQTLREDLGDEIRQAGATLTVGELPRLPVISGQMSLVFQNLIGNSLKYRKEGTPPQIRIEAVRKDLEWVFSVSDNGIGFDPAQSEKIFIMFERLHGDGKYPGDGMGLAIVRKIVEKHGGRIWAESRPDEGAVFYFTLPLDRERAEVPAT